MKLRVTLTIEYDANVDNYGTTVPELVAKVDQEEFDKDPTLLIDMVGWYQSTVKVEPV